MLAQLQGMQARPLTAHQDGEFVTGQAGEHRPAEFRLGVDESLGALCQGTQQGIASGMAEAVVHRLEVVEAEAQQGDGRGVGILGQPLLAGQLEVTAIADLGEGVGAQGVAELGENSQVIVVQPLHVAAQMTDFARFLRRLERLAFAIQHLGQLPVQARNGLGDVASDQHHQDQEADQGHRQATAEVEGCQLRQAVFQ
ncbi:hypothetical protein Q3H58_003602 [Pseudomonas psychrotolerans]|nr:hypothetical protein [Pseudomonas psychrotolerans]